MVTDKGKQFQKFLENSGIDLDKAIKRRELDLPKRTVRGWTIKKILQGRTQR